MNEADFVVDVMELIRSRRLYGIAIGNPVDRVRDIFGHPEFPDARLGKRSKLCSHLYGNLSFISEGGVVVSIDIDMHGNRARFIDAVCEIKNMDEWTAFFDGNKWPVNKTGETVSANCNGVILGISHEGEVGMISVV